MKYKTLFRLLLKVIGLWLLAQGLLSTVAKVPELQWWLFEYDIKPWWTAFPVHGVLSMGLGTYLFFGGNWIVNLAIPGNHCAECGYDLTKASGPACPECGTRHNGGS